jgi:Trk K+ transport system NAD-binding subunit
VVVPRGDTVLAEGDEVMLLTAPEVEGDVRQLLTSPQAGPAAT